MWSDKETSYDYLGYASYVSVLAEVARHERLTPLTMGIFGSWGSGKTSLMTMLKDRIDTDARGDGTVKTLWFNAWRYEAKDEAQSALIHAILAKIEENRTLVGDIKDTLGRLKKGASVLKLAKFITKTAVTMTPDFSGLLDCFQEQSAQVADTMETFESDFSSLLGSLKIDRIVVFIDDLDRCSSAKVIETFETIKLFLNIPTCTFVIGADALKIEAAVGDIYSVGDSSRAPYSRDYLEKIIQIPFTIPEQTLDNIECYVGMLVVGNRLEDTALRTFCSARPGFFDGGLETPEAIRQWCRDNQPDIGGSDSVIDDLDSIMPYVRILAGGLRGNPRQIKRFLNVLEVRKRLAQTNKLQTDTAVLVKLAVVEYVWPDFFDDLVGTVDPRSGTSELLTALVSDEAAVADAAKQSQMVADAASHSGLSAFLSGEPALSGDTDLLPYLFLAQTSLVPKGKSALAPGDEIAGKFSDRISSSDPMRSRTAAKQVAALDTTASTAIVRALSDKLAMTSDPSARTNIVIGMHTICSAHRTNYPAGIKLLDSIDPGRDDALAIAAGAFLSDAEAAGATVDQTLKDRFNQASPLAAALAPRGRSR